MSCEINKIHSKGNTFPGHTELTSLGDIEDKEFSGEIKIALLSEEGKPVSDENSYVIRPLTVDLARKKLPEIASEVSSISLLVITKLRLQVM